MKLQVKNLGPIRQGEMSLDKNFYVFVGYNNTGKTYMAHVIWTLFDLWHSKTIFNSILRLETSFPKNIEDTTGKSFDLDEKIVKEIIEVIEGELRKEVIQNFNSDNLDANFSVRLIGAFDLLKKEVMSCKIVSGRPEKFYTLLKETNSFNFKITEIEKTAFYADKKSIFIDLHLGESFYDRLYEIFLKTLLKRLIIEEAPFFLPANRSFYPVFYKDLVFNERIKNDEIIKEAIANNEIEKLKNIYRRSYTRPASVLINSIYQLNFKNSSMSKPTHFYDDLILDLNKIIGGEIEDGLRGNGMVEFSMKLENEKVLDMHVASSSANQLTTLYLYLKYWAAESNNFLIIDEPEENEHPKNQIKLLDILMRFANRNNNRVLITTHSPLLTDAVNNHLHLGYLKSRGVDTDTLIKKNELPFDTEGSALPHENIGIYFFNGTSIKEYQVGDYGAFFTDFRETEDNIRATADILKNEIYNLEKLDRLEKRKNNA